MSSVDSSSHRVVSAARALRGRPVADAVAGAGIETEQLGAHSVILETGAATEGRNVRKFVSRFVARQGSMYTRFYIDISDKVLCSLYEIDIVTLRLNR